MRDIHICPREICPVPGYTGVVPGIVNFVGMTFGTVAKLGNQVTLENRDNPRSPLSEGTIISGYRGHLPGLQFVPKGWTFAEEINHVVADFRKRYRCGPSSNENSFVVRDPLTPAVNEKTLLLSLKRNSKHAYYSETPKIPTTGYTGHVPWLRTSPTASLGRGFTESTLRSLKEFQQQRDRLSSFSSRPISLGN